MSRLPARNKRVRRRDKRFRTSLSVETLERRAMLAGDIVISEFAAAGTTLEDEDGDRNDWIELHNTGSEPVDLSTWHLTDDIRNSRKWPLSAEILDAEGNITNTPSVVLDPGAFLVVFASAKDRHTGGILHTNFKLSAAGEYLALTDSVGEVVDVYADWPTQVDGTTYGRAETEIVLPLVASESAARYEAPSEELGAVSWVSADYDDSEWLDATASIGYATDPFDDLLDVYGNVAYGSPAGASGNQAFAGRIGLDFVVEQSITLTSLGVFDDGSDGFVRRPNVELWRRDDGGTPDNPVDDAGVEVIISEVLRGSRSPLIGGMRFTLLDEPLVLEPGAYSVVASGFSTLDRNGAGLAGGGVTQLADSDAVRFIGSRLGLPSDEFPPVPGLGPANHYAAGSFTFLTEDDFNLGQSELNAEITAYSSPPVPGNAETFGNLGSDFQVIRPIYLTELGVFDDGQDGIEGGVGVSLWSRTTGSQLVGKTFVGDVGTVEPGSGNRFFKLAEPLLLSPGDYTIVSSGFLGVDKFLHSDHEGGRLSDLNDGNGAIRFEGTGRYDIYGPNRFDEEPHHRLPILQDIGPVNRYSAGTFKYTVAALEGVETNAFERLSEANRGAYIRIPFDVGEIDSFDRLRLSARYDDGLVAYLNGTEVLRVNAPDLIAWDSSAIAGRTDAEAVEEVVFDLTSSRGLLVENAENLLAVHILSASDSDPDLILNPTLEVFAVKATIDGYFGVPTPNASNEPIYAGIAQAPQIRTAGGIVESERLSAEGTLFVEIEQSTLDSQIFYTTNGSLPTPANGIPYSDPIEIGTTTLIRAVEWKDGYLPSPADTATYLFLDDVLAVDEAPAGFTSHWNDVPTSYAIAQDPDDLAAIAGNPDFSVDEARNVIKESLRGLPTMSLVGDVEDIFGLPSGFYTNPFPRGRESEVPASVEYYEEDGSFGFQVDAGLRMMGWTSRSPFGNPRHSLRLVFRGEYGDGRLEYPLFEGSSVTSFDSLALRANGRDTWNSDYPFGESLPDLWPGVPAGAMRSVATYVRDQWSREVQADMGMTTAEGTFVHLYINGIYWGIYNPTERPDGAWAAEHRGGDEDDYDSVLFCNPSPRASHGDLTVWNQLIGILDDGVAGDAAYQRILGNDPDGRRNVNYPVLLDVDNFIDYMISGYHDAADDWPCNFYAHRPRDQNDIGFTFTTWDNDLGLILSDVSANLVRSDLFGAVEGSPNRVHAALAQNSDYLSRFADRVQMHFFGDGALTPQKSLERWQRITDQVRPGIIAESARWGYYRRDIDTFGEEVLYTKTDHWDVVVQDMFENYFPTRSQVVLEQLRGVGLFPETAAPAVSRPSGPISPGTEVSLTADTGTLYYTLDGSDPREASPNLTLLNDDSIKHVIIPSNSSLGNEWTSPSFNDNGWSTARGGVGHDFDGNANWKGNFIEFDSRAMFDVEDDGSATIARPSVYVRVPFRMSADQLVGLDTLKLKMRVDDGFVAYLNGDVVARLNAPRRPDWDSFATGDVTEGTAKIFRDFDISFSVDQLVEGENVLAIHGMASAFDDFDLLIGTELIAGIGDGGVVSSSSLEYAESLTIDRTTELKARVFENGKWGPLVHEKYFTEKLLRISELFYNPPGTSDATEFVELVNIGTDFVDLTGVHFLDGIGYEFLPGDDILELAPGQYLLIAKDPGSLRIAYPDLPPDVLIADRGFVGQLSNSGEVVTLAQTGGVAIHSFTYSDTWFPTTDGGGYSLSISDPSADVSRWNVADAWERSSNEGGSPGIGPFIISPPANHGVEVDRLENARREARSLLDVQRSFQAADLPNWPDLRPVESKPKIDLDSFFDYGELTPVTVLSDSARFAAGRKANAFDTNKAKDHSLVDAVLAEWHLSVGGIH